MFYRIQKLLLLGEYRSSTSSASNGDGDGDEDSVNILIESPFAQVDRCGRGIRAVQLGLGKHWLFVAVDDFEANPRVSVWKPCHDPEVDCLELLCALPLQFLRLKVERHAGGREVLRVTLVTGRRLYFEFGGDGMLRPLLVSTWRDRIQEMRSMRVNGRKEKINDGEATTTGQEDESLLLREKLPQHLWLFFEQRSDSSSICSKASTDVESCIYEWDRRHRTREKRRLAKRMASILSQSCEQIPNP